MKQKIFSLILGTIVGLAIFFLASSLLGTNASSKISKFKTSQFSSSKNENISGTNWISSESTTTSWSWINSIHNKLNYTWNRWNITWNSNFKTWWETDFSWSKQFIIKRGNRKTTTQ
jgi:hypothetical protein